MEGKVKVMKKKRRLKRWVRVTLKGMLAVLVIGVFYGLMVEANNNLNEMYEQCDNAKGYTCSYYEARLYSIRGE